MGSLRRRISDAPGRRGVRIVTAPGHDRDRRDLEADATAAGRWHVMSAATESRTTDQRPGRVNLSIAATQPGPAGAQATDRDRPAGAGGPAASGKGGEVGEHRVVDSRSTSSVRR
jgi:hypothetical protein